MIKAQFDVRISTCLLDFVHWLKVHNVKPKAENVKEFCILRGIEFTDESELEFKCIKQWNEIKGPPR